MGNNENKVILGSGVAFSKWRSSLQAKLARREVIDHVFHDIEGIDAALRPTLPDRSTQSDEQFEAQIKEYRKSRTKWILGEIEAKNIIIDRLSASVCPETYDNLTAKQLYDGIARTRQESATAPYAVALERFLSTKFTSRADKYCDRFLSNLQSVNNAAEIMISSQSSSRSETNTFKIGPGQAAAIFVLGTKGTDWLDTWRTTRAYETDYKYSSLESMMSSLRSITGDKKNVSGIFCAAAATPSGHTDPEAECRKCRHRHKNKECFKQHPELIPRSKEENRKRRKGKAKIASEVKFESESESEDGTVGSIASVKLASNKIPTI